MELKNIVNEITEIKNLNFRKLNFKKFQFRKLTFKKMNFRILETSNSIKLNFQWYKKTRLSLGSDPHQRIISFKKLTDSKV